MYIYIYWKIYSLLIDIPIFYPEHVCAKCIDGQRPQNLHVLDWEGAEQTYGISQTKCFMTRQYRAPMIHLMSGSFAAQMMWICIYSFIHLFIYSFIYLFVCLWPQSYVTTRFMLCFSACQGAFMCIFLHACHADRPGGRGGFWVRGWCGGGLIAFCRLLPVASSFRHAPDVTLYRSSVAIFDTLPMLRSIDLLLQSSTRSRCYAL